MMIDGDFMDVIIETKFGTAKIGQNSYRSNDGKVHYWGSVNLFKLKQKVIDNNHLWKIINEENAIKSIESVNIPLEELVKLR